MATLLKEPPARLPHLAAEIPRVPVSAHPLSTLTPGPERFSVHDAAVALLLACGEWGALAHGVLWYALLHGLLRRELEPA